MPEDVSSSTSSVSSTCRFRVLGPGFRIWLQEAPEQHGACPEVVHGDDVAAPAERRRNPGLWPCVAQAMVLAYDMLGACSSSRGLCTHRNSIQAHSVAHQHQEEGCLRQQHGHP